MDEAPQEPAQVFNSQPEAHEANLGRPLNYVSDVDLLREMVKDLWTLLDDIDTASDMFKPCESNGSSFEAFYKYSMCRASLRHTKVTSDGYDLFLTKGKTTEGAHDVDGRR